MPIIKVKKMRLDKFLKVSRLIKRRTIANEACDAGKVSINGRPAEAGSTLKIGDIITLNFGERSSSFMVLSLNERAIKDEAAGMYKPVTEDQK